MTLMRLGEPASLLRMAQPALSLQIQALERSLGVELFDRGARPIRLTPEGERFLEKAHLILELADRAVERVRDVARKGTILKFGTSALGQDLVVDEILQAARTRLPDLDLQVQLGTTVQNILALNRRMLDVVYGFLPFESPETPRYLALGTIELVLAIPEGHRFASTQWVPREELLNEPLIVGQRGVNPPVANHLLRSLLGRADAPNVVEISDIGTRRFELVARGVGLGVVAVPREALLAIPGVIYRRVEDPAPTIDYGLLWFDDHVSPALPAFLDLAREIAHENPVLANGRFPATGLVPA